MTLPHERTRAVMNTREFLFRLTSPYNGGVKGVKKEVREMARQLLKHYPMPYDLHHVAKQCPDVFDVQTTYKDV